VVLQDQIDEQRSQYKEAQCAFDKVAYLQERHTQALEILPRYNVKMRINNQILFDSYKEIFDEVKEAREMGTKACIIISNYSDEMLEGFGIEIMACLEEASPSDLKLKDVAKHRDTRKYVIRQREKIDKDSLHKYLVNPIKMNTLARDYVMTIRQEIKRDMVTKLCNGQL